MTGKLFCVNQILLSVQEHHEGGMGMRRRRRRIAGDVKGVVTSGDATRKRDYSEYLCILYECFHNRLYYSPHLTTNQPPPHRINWCGAKNSLTHSLPSTSVRLSHQINYHYYPSRSITRVKCVNSYLTPFAPFVHLTCHHQFKCEIM